MEWKIPLFDPDIGEPDYLGIGRFREPPASFNECAAEIAKVGDGAAE